MDENQTQAEVVVPIVGVIVVPIGGTAVPGVVVPAAATVHAVGALRLSTTRLRHRLAYACWVNANNGVICS